MNKMNKLRVYVVVVVGFVILATCLMFGTPGAARGEAAGPSCQYSISPPSASFPGAGGAAGFDVSTTSECAWFASVNGDAPWITITSQPADSSDKDSLTF